MTVNTNPADSSQAVRPPVKPAKPAKKLLFAEGLNLQAQELSVNAGPKKALVSDLSLNVQRGELVVVTGTSAEEITALLEALAGLARDISGKVLVNELPLYAHRKAFRPYIGFVPAGNTLHDNLTVVEILYYQARLHMARGTQANTIDQQVGELLALTGLEKTADRRFASLNNLEKRLVNIAVELVNHPGLLLVDAPAVPLDPSEEARITQLLRSLARRGCTVIQASEVSNCAMLADKVLLLAPGGVLAWFGPAEEGLAWFHSQAPNGKNAVSAFDFDDVLALVKTPAQGKPETWFERFRTQRAYQKYIDDPLKGRLPDLDLQDKPLAHFRGSKNETAPPPLPRQASGLTKLSLLIDRGFRLLVRERTVLFMLAIVPLIALSDLLLSSPDMADPMNGDPGRTPIVLGVLVFLVALLAAMLFRNEISKERVITQREQRASPFLMPYLLSKIWFVGIFAIYQGLVWAVIHFLASGMAGGATALPAYWVTLTMLAFIGGLLGLIASAAARTPQAIPVWILVLVLPQLFLSGSIIPLPHLSLPARVLSWASPSRYAFAVMMTASGYGRDLANDSCWQLPEDQRTALTDQQKQSCTCLGDNIYSKCNFPGIHKFFTFVIEQPKPEMPTPGSSLNSLPAQPLLKPGDTLDSYSTQVNKYTLQLEQYQAGANAYNQSLQQFSSSLADWQQKRSLVVGNAEGVLGEAYDHYGEAFQVNPFQQWAILIAMSVILVIPLIVLEKRKGGI